MKNSILIALLSASVLISGCSTEYLTGLDQGGRTPVDSDALDLAVVTSTSEATISEAVTSETEISAIAETGTADAYEDTVQPEESQSVSQVTAPTTEKPVETTASASEGAPKPSGSTKPAETAASASEGASKPSGNTKPAEKVSATGSTAAREETAASGTEESFVYDVSELTYVAEGEYYYDVASVVLYLDEYGELPENYITKEEAKERGWQGGSVESYVSGAAIGGDYFGNYNGKLPKNEYHECDIDTKGYRSRGSRRLIYSDDGKYYYTKDHYETFTELTVPQCEKMLSSGS